MATKLKIKKSFPTDAKMRLHVYNYMYLSRSIYQDAVTIHVPLEWTRLFTNFTIYITCKCTHNSFTKQTVNWQKNTLTSFLKDFFWQFKTVLKWPFFFSCKYLICVAWWPFWVERESLRFHFLKVSRGYHKHGLHNELDANVKWWQEDQESTIAHWSLPFCSKFWVSKLPNFLNKIAIYVNSTANSQQIGYYCTASMSSLRQKNFIISFVVLFYLKFSDICFDVPVHAHVAGSGFVNHGSLQPYRSRIYIHSTHMHAHVGMLAIATASLTYIMPLTSATCSVSIYLCKPDLKTCHELLI